MNKPFNSKVNYSTALMAFKAVNKICPSYLSKRFVLCRPPEDGPGMLTRAGAENKLRVQRNRNKFDSKIPFFTMPPILGTICPTILDNLNLY